MIKYKGFQVPPAELEAVLLTHPSIADAAVIPYPDEEAGEVPKGVIVLKQPVEPETILAFVAERVAPHKRIRHIEFVDQIPKSPSGKILRRVLVDMEKAKSQAARPESLEKAPDPARYLKLPGSPWFDSSDELFLIPLNQDIRGYKS